MKILYTEVNLIIQYITILSHTVFLTIDRSIRRSVRSGSIKLKQTYEHLMENGDIGAMNRVTSSRSRPQDLDIKLLQAKRQQAEMRRYSQFMYL